MGPGADHGATVNEWVNIVRRARLDRTTKYVALMLASYADPNGRNVFPSLARVAVQCRIGYGTARRVLARLREVGLVELVRRGNRRRRQADEYRLILGAQLQEHVTVPSPDQERAEIEAIAERHRLPAGKRVRGRSADTSVDTGLPLTQMDGKSADYRSSRERITAHHRPPTLHRHPPGNRPSIT